ncbi:MAG: 1,4-dihydroxy-6-naphthoate synthase [Alistipes sp.]|jgi:1,4-dihydroxy-6-naphthoate synthase|nr:1,4-dihydroxy-6-naphthoate synthase [Alistipes sp.]
MRLTLNISPCPNDTFMFDGLINGRIDTRDYEFDVTFADIEELNSRVMGSGVSDTQGAPHISKISYAVLPAIVDRYALLDSGSALGHGNGPVFVARRGFGRESDFVVSSDFSVAIPGIHTTANLLLQKLFPQITDRRPMLFSEIASAIERREVDAGVLIHEGRFTYADHGLELIADLGVEWDKTTDGLPLPLGAIVASRALPPEVVRDVEEMIRESIEYGFAHPAASREFIKSHAQEMDDAVIDNHILLFVNDNSLTLSSDARRAIHALTGVR